MSLATPSKIRELQIKLYRKAKNEPGYRFYMLYDKIYREDILAHAYALARPGLFPGTASTSHNRGCAGPSRRRFVVSHPKENIFLVETWQETRLDSRPRVRRNVAMSAESQLESSCSQPNAGDGVSTPGMYMAFEMLLRALFNPEILNAQIDLCPRAVI